MKKRPVQSFIKPRRQVTVLDDLEQPMKSRIVENGRNEHRFRVFPWRRSAIFLADGMENIQGLDRLIQDNYLVLDISGNAVHVPLLERLLLRADEEGRPAGKDHAHLLVWMAMLGHHGMGFQVHKRQHHLVTRTGGDVDAGENLVTGQFAGGWKIMAHALGSNGKTPARMLGSLSGNCLQSASENRQVWDVISSRRSRCQIPSGNAFPPAPG